MVFCCCSYQRQSDKTSQILKLRPSSADKNLNLINNNNATRQSREEELQERASKRRSFHPQDFLSKVRDQNSHVRYTVSIVDYFIRWLYMLWCGVCGSQQDKKNCGFILFLQILTSPGQEQNSFKQLKRSSGFPKVSL